MHFVRTRNFGATFKFLINLKEQIRLWKYMFLRIKSPNFSLNSSMRT